MMRTMMSGYLLTPSIKSYRSGCDLAAVQNEWQGLKILVSQNFKDKSYSGLWETMLTKEPYREEELTCCTAAERDNL